MNRHMLLLAVLVLVGCDNSATIGEAGDPGSPGEPAHPAVKQAAPLTAAPFLPTLSPHRMAVANGFAIVADPEGPNSDGRRPAVHLVPTDAPGTLTSLELPDGTNPGAVEVNRATGTAYVVARGAGGVYPIDLGRRQLGAFIATCPAPVDVAAKGDGAVVACLGGELVTLTAAGTATVQQLGRPLTSVAVGTTEGVVVGTAEGELVPVGGTAWKPPPVDLTDGRKRQLNADTVRRLVATPGGGVAMLFQQSVDGELQSGGPNDPASTMQPTGGGYSGGGVLGCSVPAARAAVTVFKPSQGLRGSQASTAALAVDLAVSPDGKRVAVVDAAGGGVELVPETTVSLPTSSGCGPDLTFGGIDDNGTVGRTRVPVESPMAAAFTPDERLVVLSGSPSLQIRLFSKGTLAAAGAVTIRARAVPRGFTLFHSRPGVENQSPNGIALKGAGITCGTCHPDGLSNGAVTTLGGVKHRVMPLAGRLAGATHVHWDNKPFSEAVAIGTWQKQMGGAPLASADEASLKAFVGQLQLPHRAELGSAALAAGEAAFAKAQCGGCHIAATDFANGGAADVGLGTHKVPSLRGLAYSAPYMSNGCAKTLEARFADAACGGGDQHGRPSLLSKDETTALIAYLRSL